MSLGNRLRKIREVRNLSQKEVAEMLNISNAVLSNYERNYRDPDTKVLMELAKLYNISIDYLLGLVDVPLCVNSNEQLGLDKLNYKHNATTYNERIENINILEFLCDELITIKTSQYEQLQFTLKLMKEELELKRKIEYLEKHQVSIN